MFGFRIKNRRPAIKRRLRGSLAVEATISLTCLIILAVCGIMIFRIITLNSAIHYASTQSLENTNEVLIQLAGIGALDGYRSASTGVAVSDDAVKRLKLSLKEPQRYKKWENEAPQYTCFGALMRDAEVYMSQEAMTALADSFCESRMLCEYCQYDFVQMAKDYRAAWADFQNKTGAMGQKEYETLIQKLYAYNMHVILESYLYTEISDRVLDPSQVQMDHWEFSLDGHVLNYSCDVTYTVNLPLPFVKIKAKTIKKHVIGVANLME